MEVETFSAEESRILGEEFGRKAKRGEIYCLDGDLGAGKTVFAQGFARGLGVMSPVDSPTFTIMKQYEGRLPLYHFDLYRIEDPSELSEIGYEEFFFGDGVSLVEWPERASGLLPGDAKWIVIKSDFSKGSDYRQIRFLTGQ